MREKIARTALSLLVVLAAVFAFRWTVRAVLARAYRAERDVRPMDVAVEPAFKAYDLAKLVPHELEVNIAGLSVRRSAERLGMPYSLAVDVAEQKAGSAGWERLDDENSVAIRNLSGMERVYRTPEGSIVLREVRAVAGGDSLMEDFVIPAELIPGDGEFATPDVLARRSARHVRDRMPAVLRDVVVGSPLLTELIERGGGAAFIVHCVAEMSAKAATAAVEEAARRTGWTAVPFAQAGGGGAPGSPKASWTKRNLTMQFETVQRQGGFECDVDYRFSDDEAYISMKGEKDEN